MKKCALLLTIFFMTGIMAVMAQTKRVTGVVTSSENGSPITGVSVLVKGTTLGTVTDLEGHFQLDVPGKANTLIFSFIGMATQTVTFNSNVVNVALKSDSRRLDELVVVGYGTQSAKTIASSVSTVRGSAFKDAANTSFDQALEGRASGIQVTSPAGVVGQPPIIHIRGVNSITSGTSPLYVVDGVPVLSGDIGFDQMGQANALADINPNDILTIEVLKDASAAAMYGSRAANGVVLITTKGGSRDKMKVNYDGWVGVSQYTNFIDVMNAEQYVTYKNGAVKNRYGTDQWDLTNNVATTDGTKAFNLMKDANGNIISSKWRDAVFQNGITQNHSLSVSGGSDKTQYFISGNYMDQQGMVIGDEYNRLGLKSNITTKVNDYLKIGANINTTTSTTSAVDAARNGEIYSVGGFPRLALVNPSNLPIYNADGTPYFSTSGGVGYGANTVKDTYSNPAELVAIGNKVSTDVNRLISNFYAELTPLTGLTLKTQYGIDYTRTENRRFWSPIHGDGYGSNNGDATNAAASYKQWVWSNTATYDLKVDDHNFNFLGGMEASQYDFAVWGIEKNHLTDLKYTDEQGPFLTAIPAMEGKSSHSMISYLGRINYDYKAKYMASLNFRRDGYSELGDSKWGNFGGASVAWRVSEEPFFSSVKDIIDDAKIKGSWGVVGNTDIGSYPAKSYYSSFYYGNNSVYQLGQIGNSALKWESSTKYDAGASLHILNNISVDFDYYVTETNNLILNVPQSPSKGIPGGAIKTNVGKMKNNGIEVTIGADVIKTRDFTWNSSLNFTTNKNRVVALADGVTEILGNDGAAYTNITEVGKSIGQLYLYPTKGIDQTTGRRIYITPEGKETLFMYEQGQKGAWFYRDGTQYKGGFQQVEAGNTVPTYYGGWNNNFKYKNFDLTVFFQFSGGNKIYNGTTATTSDNRFWNNSLDVLNNYWTPGRTNAKYALPIYGDNYSNGSAMPITDWVEDGDYCRLKNVVLGYSFNTKNWSRSIGISSLRLYVQAQNLFVITKYSGIDPETLSMTSDYNLSAGIDKNTMPQARVYTFGVNIAF